MIGMHHIAVMVTQILAAVSGFAGAYFWWASASKKFPPLLADGGKNMQAFMANVGRLNKMAAGFTALSVLSGAVMYVIGLIQLI